MNLPIWIRKNPIQEMSGHESVEISFHAFAQKKKKIEHRLEYSCDQFSVENVAVTQAIISINV